MLSGSATDRSIAKQSLHVLFSAYACAPNRGSEPSAGWNWPMAMARRGHRVTVLTTPRYREAIDEALRETAPPKPTFVFIDEPPLDGVWRAVPDQFKYLLRYLLWQERLPTVARQLGAIDIVHHVTWGSLRGGSRLTVLPAPLVFGPVGGGQRAPRELLGFMGSHARAERVRSALVSGSAARMLGNARHVARRSAVVFVTNSATHQQALALGARRIEPMLDSGIDAAFIARNLHRDWTSPALELLWLGRLLPRKGLGIALEALARVGPSANARLSVVGDGPEMPRMQALADRLHVADRVTWYGQVPWEDVRRHLDRSHLFVFTSIRDSFGSQLLEATARGLPVLTLDHHGARDHLPGSVAIKVPVSSASQTVEALARAIGDVAANRRPLPEMSAAAVSWADQHTWDKRAEACERIYLSVRSA